MLNFPRWKIWSTITVLVLGILLSLPNFLPRSVLTALPDGVPKAQINLGLDLRGGSHILLEADTADVRKQRLDTLEETVRAELRSAPGGRISFGDMSLRNDRLTFLVRDVNDVDRAVEAMRGISQPVGVTGQRDLNVEVIDGSRIVLTITASGLSANIDSAMQQAVEVIRRRIDELGTREPTIIRQGKDRIVVQVPGLQDPSQLKALLGKTAKLEFKLVDVEADAADVAAGRAPAGSEVLPNAEGAGNVAVKRRAIISGDQLIDAAPSFQDGVPVVSFRFDSAGGKRFARATTENVGKPFAIVLDGRVISAPNINEPILGGSGIIQGSFTTETANELAILLRSGKLPVELTVVEERTVGPDLGADSIRAGIIASAIAVVAVGLFMFLTYGRFGLYANIALVLNIFLIMAIMSVTGATLTLPGVAGMVLTIGAAVDANVLINERIREEQRKGRNIANAIETGFKEASRTIWDANSMNIIVAVVMFWFGSGPIKGFAVVLSIGIATSVFTAVTVTRMLASHWLRSRPTTLVV
ncbi:protein translocase subunit SecD [Sphingoaurantiacus capsulatus]|uniref:Protein translocase subunit SecD n=1 Tax=Sphingoaurantiacus capsulatus TaxID=1771310 RepID=A0ABV7XF85_9SPHN